MSPTKRPSGRVDQAVVDIERLIFKGELKSGEHIKELDIANRLGISRGAVREAFKSLARSRLVDIVPHRGVFVRAFSYKETLDMFDMRVHFALMALPEAAQNITPRKAAELHALLDRIDEANKEGDPDTVMSLNWEFHSKIYDLCDNSILKTLAEDIRMKQYLSCRHSFRVPTSVADSNQEHRLVLERLERNDGEGAAKAMAAHVMCGKRRFLEAVNPDQLEKLDLHPPEREEHPFASFIQNELRLRH
ncbi:MAG: GntR family transcriptional regulator [Desulfovibrionaceae bacterium]|nr:GntR family transcriptional regulator [Desulfovibrionaceae bacterium]